GRFRLSETASSGTQRKSMLASGSFLRSRSSSARMKAVEPGSTWLHHSTWPKYQNCTARKTVTIAASVQARPRRTMRPGPARLPRPRVAIGARRALRLAGARAIGSGARRSEEHTSELQSRENLVCRLLLEKKKEKQLTM